MDDDARDERRRTSRSAAERAAQLRSADLVLEGTIKDVSAGGAFLSTRMLVETGEHGHLIVGDIEVPVEVVWLRGNAHAEGPGMGLAFTDGDPQVARLLEALGSAQG